MTLPKDVGGLLRNLRKVSSKRESSREASCYAASIRRHLGRRQRLWRPSRRCEIT